MWDAGSRVARGIAPRQLATSKILTIWILSRFLQQRTGQWSVSQMTIIVPLRALPIIFHDQRLCGEPASSLFLTFYCRDSRDSAVWSDAANAWNPLPAVISGRVQILKNNNITAPERNACW